MFNAKATPESVAAITPRRAATRVAGHRDDVQNVRSNRYTRHLREPCVPPRKYDWAGPRFSRGLAPRCEPEVPEPHATIPSVAHGDQPMSSQSATARPI